MNKLTKQVEFIRAHVNSEIGHSSGWWRNAVLDLLAALDGEVGEGKTLRRLLWEEHSHIGKYGDDGEMQCGGIDFLRDPVESIDRHMIRYWTDNKGKA